MKIAENELYNSHNSSVLSKFIFRNFNVNKEFKFFKPLHTRFESVKIDFSFNSSFEKHSST